MTTQKMLSPLRKAITDFKMINNNDKIAVGVSGGKDSVALLKLLHAYQKFSPEKFELLAITIDLRFDKEDTNFSSITNMCNDMGIEHYIERTDIGEIIFDVRKEKSPCALCSKMRKGALNDLAKKLNCNKVAFGHHSDDLVETMLLSLFYEARLSTFAPKSYLDKTNLTLIRPMLYIKESDVNSYVKKEGLPIVKNKCPADEKTKREYVKNLIKEIELKVPNAKKNMFLALTNPNRYNLFDKFFNDVNKF